MIMKYLHSFASQLLFILLTLSFYITGCNSENSGGVTSNETIVLDEVISVDETSHDVLSTAEVSGLDAKEASHLTFMREEEKLARDVYLTLAELYPDQMVFSQIATRSEAFSRAHGLQGDEPAECL